MSGYRPWRITGRDSVRLAVRDYGDPLAEGAPMLCLSGLTRTAADFDAFAHHHAAHRRVVAFDYRGHGNSERAGRASGYAPENLLDDVLQVTAALNLDRPVVLGTSLGGSLAMALAVAAPTRIRATILNDIGPEIPNATMGRILDIVGRDHPQDTWAQAAEAIPRIYPNLGVTDADTLMAIAKTTFVAGGDGRLHVNWDPRIVQPLRRAASRDMWPLFGALRPFQVLALRGRQSDVLTPPILARMQADKPDLAVAEVAGRGHAPLLDEPESKAAIDDFLTRLDGPVHHSSRL
ncbi:alpha/beta fold hydrolase [Ferruginivarius sediminum]|uniref:Alpha/beta hydrolase n=1 Tax=Ferruginivarius sediminum TaxID=2661937 RepID=A0A369TEK2_9PROT|nr:alpha/beta hydrolase [Ferruginivarius sediminum]RDD63733.1 alpha/beta hydrolase [Ferruginivarius sediminum]